MPRGKGTYGSKRGRPPKKRKIKAKAKGRAPAKVKKSTLKTYRRTRGKYS